jgi:transposase
MKFVVTKTADQLDLQALHRVRERLVSQRTGIINQIRAFLLERGIAVRQGQRFLRVELPRILATPPDVLSLRMVRVIEGLASDWHGLDERIEGLSSEIEELAKRDAGCERLMSVPGIGPTYGRAGIKAPRAARNLNHAAPRASPKNLYCVPLCSRTRPPMLPA